MIMFCLFSLLPKEAWWTDYRVSPSQPWQWHRARDVSAWCRGTRVMGWWWHVVVLRVHRDTALGHPLYRHRVNHCTDTGLTTGTDTGLTTGPSLGLHRVNHWSVTGSTPGQTLGIHRVHTGSDTGYTPGTHRVTTGTPNSAKFQKFSENHQIIKIS